MKKRGLIAVIAAAVVLSLCVGMFVGLKVLPGVMLARNNYTGEMKMEYRHDFQDDGGNSVERVGDHKNSPYYYSIDIYNAKPTETLSILPHFQTIQQTSSSTCGVSATEMVLNYYGMRGDWNEKSLFDLRTDHEHLHPGTCLNQIIEMFEKVGGFELETTYDYLDDLSVIDLEFIRQHIEDGIPLIVCWCDWGGHWQVIIGYDTMGTDYTGDDVIIVADSFDLTDHNHDGYGIYSAERFLSEFSLFDFFADVPEHTNIRDKVFVAAKPIDK